VKVVGHHWLRTTGGPHTEAIHSYFWGVFWACITL